MIPHSLPDHPSSPLSVHHGPFVPVTFLSIWISRVIWSVIGCESNWISISPAVIVCRPSRPCGPSCPPCRACPCCCTPYPCCRLVSRLSCGHPLVSGTCRESIFCGPRTCCGNAISIYLGIHCDCGYDCVVFRAISNGIGKRSISSISCVATMNSSFCREIVSIWNAIAISKDSGNNPIGLCSSIFRGVSSVGR